GIEVVEQPGRGRAGDADPRAALPAELEHPLAVPRRDEVERVLLGVEDPRALDVHVEVDRVHEPRPVAVRARGQGADHLLLADLGVDGDDLPGLYVRAEADGEVGEALERRGVEGGGGAGGGLAGEAYTSHAP